MEEFEGIDLGSLNDIRAVAHDIEAQNARDKVGQVLGQSEQFMLILSETLATVGVDWDFNVSTNEVWLLDQEKKIFNKIHRDTIEFYHEEGFSPEALAFAIRAGMIDPKHFCFWRDDEEEEHDEE